jgi:hypothetical protein
MNFFISVKPNLIKKKETTTNLLHFWQAFNSIKT